MAGTPGKYRHLTRCSTAEGHLVILAIDHRANLQEALHKTHGEAISDAEFTAFKQTIVRGAAGEISGVLGDPAYVVGAGIADRTLGRLGLLCPVEVTNYGVHPSVRDTEFIADWDIGKLKRVGADGVKLLLYYHPGDPQRAVQKRALVERLIETCAAFDIPLFLEPIAYSLDPHAKLSSAELRDVTVEAAKTFAQVGVDVLKLEFPLDVATDSIPGVWTDALRDVDAACGDVPWALLSAGVAFEVFEQQAQAALEAGASGVIVGRAAWNEAMTLPDAASVADFARTTVVERMKTLGALCRQHGKPWWNRTARPAAEVDWYRDYSGLEGGK